jgi:hypothetical protein
VPSEELTTRYEELRTHALARAGRGLGLTLFLREGMCSWMRSCAQSITLARNNMANHVTTVNCKDLVVPAEFTMLLAGIALEICKEVLLHPCSNSLIK